MSAKINVKDWILISAYIDDALTSAEAAKLQSRLATDWEFQQAVDEISYTKRMLRALPPRRAPRNFTISSEKIKAKTGMPVGIPWLKPALSFVSIASAALFIFIFASPLLFNRARSAAPMMQAAPEMAMDSANKSSEITAKPVIINWINAYGMGGGDGSDLYTGGGGVGGAGGPGWIVSEPEESLPLATEAPVMGEELVPTEVPLDPNNGGFGGGPSPTEMPVEPPAPAEAPALALPEPQTTATPGLDRQMEETGGNDLSTLILGVPDPATSGQVIVTEETTLPRERKPISSRVLFMILSASIALLAGAAAVIFRRH